MLPILYCCCCCCHRLAGDGKSHYIKKQLAVCPSYKTIAINEAFTPNKAISKLRSLPLYQKKVGIFFNFTILPPGVSGMVDHITLVLWGVVVWR